MASAAAVVSMTVRVCLTSMYASLEQQKLNFNNEVLNLNRLPIHVMHESLAILTQFFVLNLDN